MNTQEFRNAFALPALIVVGMLGNLAPARAQPMILQHPVGSWLYTVTIPVDGNPAHNIVFQGLETYIMDGGYIETDQLSFSPTLGLSTPSHGSWASTGGSDFLMKARTRNRIAAVATSPISIPPERWSWPGLSR